jgi:acetyl-CoA carboxylase, biotin carboxylase subunit
LTTYRRPQGTGVRVDDGFEEGMDIPIYYDPMISKLITHGKDREEAIRRMVRAIEEYQITGVETTLDFCKFAIQHESFVSGDFNTHFVGDYFTPDVLQNESEEGREIAALLAAGLIEQKDISSKEAAVKSATVRSAWKMNRI